MLNSILTTPVHLFGLLMCLGSAVILGVLSSMLFSFKHRISASFALTLALLPLAMSMVVMMVNGNFGVAVAVAGSFTLVRFRSIAGNGREICAVFIEMALGVIVGMGYIGIALIFFLIVAILVITLSVLHFGETRNEKLLRITIPEDYDYENLFQDIFEEYHVQASIVKIKTTNLGSLIDVTYRVILPGPVLEKKMLDELRTRNGNLGIMVSAFEEERESL